MAPASSAQREPSMEEILASIRRIIEDSDTGRKPADEFQQDLESAPLEKSVDAFRAELRAQPEEKKPTLAEVQAQLSNVEPVAPQVLGASEVVKRSPAEQPQATVTLAEIGGQVAAQPAVASKNPTVARTSEPADAIMTDWRRDIAAAAAQADKPAAAPQETATPQVTISTDDAPTGAVDEADLDISENELVTGVLDLPTQSDANRADAFRMLADASPGKPAIVSEHVGRQVAAAFGELSDAFAARSKKSFDEMAEDMLRPMLQDWLDNNLPTLVERLVREEIERVARGA